jgi:hypothetical protein
MLSNVETADLVQTSSEPRKVGESSEALFIRHRLVPVSALVPAHHPQRARYHCIQGSPHHHLPNHDRYNVDRPSLLAPFMLSFIDRDIAERDRR